jgi:hypothetical protein
MTQSNYDLLVIQWLGFCVGMVSLLCSATTLLLIGMMKTWNGYLLLITSMTICQVLYDVNYILGVVPTYGGCLTWHFLDVLGGLGVACWTSIISFIVMFVVRKIHSFNIFRHYALFCFIAVICPLGLAIIDAASLQPANADDDQPFNHCVRNGSTISQIASNIYYWGRFATIIFNLIVFFYTSMRVQQMSYKGKLSVTTTNESQTLAVHSLVSRMKYYPLAQIISRMGAAWNEFDDYRYSCFSSGVLAAICSPITGVLYFVIFLVGTQDML